MSPADDKAAVVREWGLKAASDLAAAKGADFCDVSLRFAQQGRTHPRTLTRAAREFAQSKPSFAMAVGRFAIERLLHGFAYDLTPLDIRDTRQQFLAAAEILGQSDAVVRDATTLAPSEPSRRQLLPALAR